LHLPNLQLRIAPQNPKTPRIIVIDFIKKNILFLVRC